MNPIANWAMTLLFLLSGIAYAQVPASNDTSDGNSNTGVGSGALGGPATSKAANANTALGYYALESITTGYNNTAAGADALASNGTGSNNTATGFLALLSNTIGSNNTAAGSQALLSSLGDYNTGSGASALQNNADGYSNTAAGFQALFSNVDGYSNTASGVNALYSNTAGMDNTASGQDALFSNSTGSDNTATGVQALNSATGSGNIALGFQAGLNVTTGSGNIEIGNVGAAADNKLIKIGTEGTQKKTYIAGIYGNTAVKGLAVVIASNGELGVVSSSERFKIDIATMGPATERLRQLRPVTFHYRNDQRGELRYGLIAEEVAKVYPELVVRNEQGRIDGVRYDELAPMLLNEVQKQQQINAAQTAKIASLERKVAEIDDLKQQLSAVLQELRARDMLLAQR